MTGVVYAPNRYHRVQMNTASLNNAPTKGWVCSPLKGVPLHCIIFRTATDVACGTGVLFPDNLKRGVKRIVGIDASSEMTEIAAEKFIAYAQIQVLCKNVLEFHPNEKFDRVMHYNAFPHLFEPERLIGHLSELLTEGGLLTIAHEMSRERINLHHKGRAHMVSIDLMPADKLTDMMMKCLMVDTTISDSDKYILSGSKRD